MLRGDISNKPALAVVFLLDDFVDELKVNLLHKISIKINSQHKIGFANKLFIGKDIQVIFGVLLPSKYKKQIEEKLDEYGVMFTNLVFAKDMDELVDYLIAQKINMYTDRLELVHQYKNVLPLGEITVGY